MLNSKTRREGKIFFSIVVGNGKNAFYKEFIISVSISNTLTSTIKPCFGKLLMIAF